MVSKCANPVCSSPFLYLHEGKLFRFEHSGGANGAGFGFEPEAKKQARRVEFFWLCDHCASNMTVVFQTGVGVAVRPLARGRPAA
ncbi:MAG TPA: hypothetical protein VMT28_16870 [Terriglobales bacterium]|jgi:hypothetical protein|nr:hypothetical protein [Terriglobales bacterium]